MKLLVAALLVAAAVFTIWPGIDLAASSMFHDTATGRWVGSQGVPEFLRSTLWSLIEIVSLAMLACLALALILGKNARVPARLWVFAVTAMALGPGLVVNGLLKAYWGRARPRNVSEFGGVAEFTPALQITDQCASNCSFVAGEVAGLATLLLILWLIAFSRLTTPARQIVASTLIALVALQSVLRLAAGGHFLSDVIFAILISLTLTLGLWRTLAAATLAGHLTPERLLSDAKALLSRGNGPNSP